MDYTFDLQRIFFGDAPPLFLFEIIFRTTILYAFTLIILRIMGQRGIGQLSMFEFVIIIAIGSAVGDPMFYADVPLIHGMVVIAVIIFLQRVLTRITLQHRRIERVIEGKPWRIVADGVIDLDGRQQVKLSGDEIFMELRQQGIEQLGQVRRAYFEFDGEMSVFKFDPDQVRPGLPLLPDDDTPALKDMPVPEAGLYACCTCGHTHEYAREEALHPCPRCAERLWRKVVTPASK